MNKLPYDVQYNIYQFIPNKTCIFCFKKFKSFNFNFCSFSCFWCYIYINAIYCINIILFYFMIFNFVISSIMFYLLMLFMITKFLYDIIYNY